MASFDDANFQTRERRSGALSAFHGTLAGLTAQVSGDIKQAARTMSQTFPDDIIFATRTLGGINGAATVIHGPAGCAASSLSRVDDFTCVFSTCLDEKDSILGSDDKLREAVTHAASLGYRVVFVIGTPVVAINNDDVKSAIMELEKSTGVKIIFVPTDGFKSKMAVTGYDIVSHCLLRGLVERNEDDRDDFVNVIAMSEGAADVWFIVTALKDIGITANVLPLFSSVDAVKRAGRARASIALNGGEGDMLVLGLQARFGVPAILSDVPVGTKATGRFIRAIAGHAGLSGVAESYIVSMESRVSDILDAAVFDGARVFLDMDLAAAVSFGELVEELGGEVSGIKIPYIDENNKHLVSRFKNESMSVIVADGQPFELANALSKGNHDFYAGRSGLSSMVSSFGVIPLVLGKIASFGYDGVTKFAGRVKNATKRGDVMGASDDRYKKTWLDKSGNWHVKLEVR